MHIATVLTEACPLDADDHLTRPEPIPAALSEMLLCPPQVDPLLMRGRGFLPYP